MTKDQELVEKIKEICLQELDCDYTAEHIFYFCEQYFRQHDMQAEYNEAVTLAKFLHKTYYNEVTQWEPLNNTLGVITQIDNMVTGIPNVLKQHDMQMAIEAVESIKTYTHMRESDFRSELKEAIKEKFKE